MIVRRRRGTPYVWVRSDAIDSPRLATFAQRLRVSRATALGYLVIFMGTVAKQTQDGDYSSLPDGLLDWWAHWRGKDGHFGATLRAVWPNGRGLPVRVKRPEWRKRRRDIPVAVRERVYARDGYRCLRCETSERLSLDHIIPHSHGGSDDITNLRTLCLPCNSRRGAGDA